MKAIRSATADTKESVQNVVARADQHSELNKAKAQAKAERKAAENKAEKHDANAHYHTRQAEIIREYEQKKAQNKSLKEQTKAAYYQKKAGKNVDKHADKHADKTDAGIGVDDQATSYTAPPSNNPAPAGAYNPVPAGAPGEAFNDRNTSTPASSGFPETTDSNVSGATPNPGHSQIPMHGSGVPTHSELHNGGDTHDIHTTQTMGASPNTGSYM